MINTRNKQVWVTRQAGEQSALIGYITIPKTERIDVLGQFWRQQNETMSVLGEKLSEHQSKIVR